MKILVSIKKDIVNHVRSRNDAKAESLSNKLEMLISENLSEYVAIVTEDKVQQNPG